MGKVKGPVSVARYEVIKDVVDTDVATPLVDMCALLIELVAPVELELLATGVLLLTAEAEVVGIATEELDATAYDTSSNTKESGLGPILEDTDGEGISG